MKKVYLLLLILISGAMLSAFIIKPEGTANALWHQNGVYDSEAVVEVHQRLNYHWNSETTDSNGWSRYFGSTNLASAIDLTIEAPSEQYNQVTILIGKSAYTSSPVTNIREHIVVNTDSLSFVSEIDLLIKDTNDNTLLTVPNDYDVDADFHVYKIFWSKVFEVPNPDQYVTVDQLPNTRGSIFDDQMEMGQVLFQPDGNNIDVQIFYDNQVYYLRYNMSPLTDMSVFTNNYEVFYYTNNGSKYIAINHGNYSMFTDSLERVETFIPYTIWNLNTNELETVDRFSTYLYSKKEDVNNVYAYFYVDEFLIDQLLSIDLGYRYRYNYMIGSNGAWQDEHVYLESNAQAVNLDVASWQLQHMATTTAAVAIGIHIPFVRWPILLFGTGYYLWTASTIDITESQLQIGNVNQIQKLDVVSPSLKTELINAFRTADNNFEVADRPVFKLHLGQFNKAFSTGIEIDPEYSIINEQKGINVIQFTYRTNGQVYTVKGENIIVEFKAGPGTDGESNNSFSQLAFLIGGGLILLVLFSAVNQGVFTNTKKLKSFVTALITFVIIGIIIYYVITSGLLNTLLVLIL